MIGPLQDAILIVLKNAKRELTTRNIFNELNGKYEPISVNSIATAVQRLCESDLAESRKGEPSRRRGGKAQILYTITELGRERVMTAQKIRDVLNSLALG